MGTSGLVGQFEAFTSMVGDYGTVRTLIIIIVMHFILPAIVTIGFDWAVRRFGWVKKGDMKLAK